MNERVYQISVFLLLLLLYLILLPFAIVIAFVREAVCKTVQGFRLVVMNWPEPARKTGPATLIQCRPEDGPTMGEIQLRAISISQTTTATRGDANDALIAILEIRGTLDEADQLVRSLIADSSDRGRSLSEVTRSFGVSAEQAANAMRELSRTLSMPLGEIDHNRVRVGRKAEKEPELPPAEERPTRRILLQEGSDG